MKKLLYIFLFLATCQQTLMAEAIASFQIQSAYLDNGKLKLSQTSPTAFKVDVGFVRFLVGSSFESVNINFKIVAFNNASGTVIADLMPVTNITSSNYPDAYTNTIYKTYDLNINYSALGVSAANLRIALLWVSNAYPAPPGHPLGANVYNTLYQVVLLPPPSPNNNKFAYDDNTSLTYWGVEGKFRLMHYRSQYEVFGSNYASYVAARIVHFPGVPSPLGDPIGWNIYDDTYPNAFLIKNTANNQLYYVEEKLLNPGNPSSYDIYYVLRKVSNEIKTYYSLNGTPYNINVTFSGTPVVNGYVAGPDLGY